jgi:histidinol-phosphate aminotransferase
MKTNSTRAISGRPLAGKVIVITGSSSGIGRAVALGFGNLGAAIVLNGRSAKRLATTRELLQQRGIRVLAVRADVATPGGARTLIDGAFRTFGKVDVLINNAGVPGPAAGPFWKIKPADADRTMAVNLRAAALCSSAYVAKTSGDGRIIQVSSTAGRRPYAGLAAYGASKFALRGWTECMALDLERTGIVVTGLELAGHRTPMTRRRLPRADYEQLPPPDEVLSLFLHAATAPGPTLHGRTFSEIRFRVDAVAEAALHQPLAVMKSWDPRMPRYRSPGTKRTLHLDFLENPLGPAPMARAAVAGSAPGALSTYPDPRMSGLREELARQLKLPAECFSFGNGSTELIDRVLRTFAREGDLVVTTDPTWPVFERMCRMNGIGLVQVPYRIDRAAAKIDLREVAAAITSMTRLVYLVNPGNPLGSAIGGRDFRAFLRAIPKHLPVVLDEAYLDYCERPGVVPAHRLILRVENPIIGIRTFSKFYGLAGMRVGYACAAPATLDLITRLHLPFPIAAVAEQAAVAALRDRGHARRTRAMIRQGREQIVRQLARIGLRSLASDSNFLMAELPAPAEAVYDALSAREIFLPEMVWEDFMQLPIGTAAQNRRYLDVISRLKKSSHGR